MCMVSYRVDLDKVPPVDCFKALLMVLDALIEDEEVQVRLSTLPVSAEKCHSLWSVLTTIPPTTGTWTLPHSGERRSLSLSSYEGLDL